MDIKHIYKDNLLYPSLLKEIYDPPDMLYYKGIIPKNNALKLSVVGSRKMSPYGKSVLECLLPPVIQAGIEIISGLAIGVDGEAARITLKNSGITHAVIGSGLSETLLYPKAHIGLAHDILKKGGSIISEHDTTVPALPRHFAMRNRIIAGLSHAVLIVEAAEKSGSLITAECALNYGREVLVVPGEITKINSKGTNTLIKNGAYIVDSPSDILSLFNIESAITETKITEPLLVELSSGPKHIDELANALHLTVSEVSARLSKLEIVGIVKNIGNMHYIKN
jgi:DNA processing protein